MINGNDEMINLRNAIMIITLKLRLLHLNTSASASLRGETLEARETRVLSETEQYFHTRVYESY